MSPVVPFFGTELRLWALFTLFGVILSWCILIPRIARLGARWELVLAWVVLALPVGAIGGRFLAGAFGPLGMSVLGSVAACLAFSWVFIRHVLRLEPLAVLDTISFSYPLSLLFGRIGCMAHGCCPGMLVGPGVPFPFAVSLGRYADGTETRLTHAAAPLSANVLNFPLVLTCFSALLLGVAIHLDRRKERDHARHGWVLGCVVAIEGLGRAALEPLRTTTFGAVSPWMLLSFALGLCGLALAFAKRPAVPHPMTSPA